MRAAVEAFERRLGAAAVGGRGGGYIPAMNGHLLLVAKAAGGVEEEAIAGARSVLAAAAPTEVADTSDPDRLAAALEGLDDRLAVVAGGDGALHVVLNALHERGLLDSTPLALLPLGTGNDFARTLGLPLDAEEAARRIVSGRPRALDLLVGSEGVVVNAAHAGLGVEAAERAAELKDRLGPVAYPAGAAAAGASADALRLSVEVDETPLAAAESLLVVGVGNGRTVGGGTELFPDADPADGLAEVLVVTDRGALERLRLGLAARSGAHVELDGVRTARGRQVVVRGAAAWNDDGELDGSERDGRSLSVAPGAWTLVG